MSMSKRHVGEEAARDFAGPRFQPYRQAEGEFWDHYGLEPTERFVQLESPAVRLRVLELGSGEPILFVHGTAGAAPVWAPLVHELRDFPCLVLDRPGWGLSSPIDFSKREYKALVGDVLVGTLDALGVDRAHVIGASIGDVWALRLAAGHPSRVARIGLMGGGPLVSDIQVPPFIRVISSPIGALMVRLPEKPGRVRSIMRGNGHGASLDAGRLDAFVRRRVALGTETNSLRHERAMVRSIVSWRRGTFRSGLLFEDAELAGIRQPALMVYGTGDPVGSVDVWRRAIGLLPKGELRVVDDAGHVPWLDNPLQVAGHVRRFLHSTQGADDSGRLGGDPTGGGGIGSAPGGGAVASPG